MVKPASELRASANRLSDNSIRTVGDAHLLSLRKCGEPLSVAMRLHFVTVRLATPSDALRMPRHGADLRARVGKEVEAVGTLLPGMNMERAAKFMADPAFVAGTVRRRVRIFNPDCWLPLNSAGNATLEVQLANLDRSLPLVLRPSARTDLVYGTVAGAKLRIRGLPSADGTQPTIGTVESVRNDGVPLMLLDGAPEAVPIDLRSPLVVSRADLPEPCYEAAPEKDEVQARVRLTPSKLIWADGGPVRWVMRARIDLTVQREVAYKPARGGSDRRGVR